MSNLLHQKNKEKVWDFWQKLNHVGVDNVPDVIRAAVHEDVDWNGSAPIDQIVGAEALISGFWLPLLHSFPDLKRAPYIFMGGIESGETHWAGDIGSEWVTGCGYLTGTFVNDWLGIPATGKKTNIHFGQFYVMREGKIAAKLCAVRYFSSDATGRLPGIAAGARRGRRQSAGTRRHGRYLAD